MSEQLKSGAYRVWDETERQYGTNWKTNVFILGENGVLYFGDNRGDNLYALAKANPARYQVERWTGLYDRDGKPVYEWDAVMADCPWVGDAQGSPKIMFVAYSGPMLGLSLCAWGTFPTDKPHWKEMGWTESSEIRLSFGNKGRLNIPLIGTVHDSPETLAAAAKVIKNAG